MLPRSSDKPATQHRRLVRGARATPASAVRVDPIERNALAAVDRAAPRAQQGQRVTGGEEGQRTLQFFADRVEGNLLAAHQEIQKLALLHPAGELQLRAGRRRGAERGALRRLQAVRGRAGRQAAARARACSDGLQAEGEAAVLVHYTLAEDIRALKRVKDAMAAGRPTAHGAAREAGSGAARSSCRARAAAPGRPPRSRACCARRHVVDGIVKGLKAARLAGRTAGRPCSDWR